MDHYTYEFGVTGDLSDEYVFYFKSNQLDLVDEIRRYVSYLVDHKTLEDMLRYKKEKGDKKK